MAKYIIQDPEVNFMLHCIDYLVLIRCIFCPVWTYYSWNSQKWPYSEAESMRIVYWIRFSLIFLFYFPFLNLMIFIVSLMSMDQKGISVKDFKKRMNLHTDLNYYTQIIVYFCNTVFGILGLRWIYMMEKTTDNWFLFSIY